MSVKWTETHHRIAVIAYLQAGTYAGAETLTGIPWATIAGWRNSADWWEDMEREASKELAAKFRSKAQKGIDLAFDRLLERIEHGDQMADGKVMPVKARELAIVLGILIDKSKVDLSTPTGTAERQSAAERMERYVKLADEAEAKRGKPN